MIKIYNTMTTEIEDFIPLETGKVSMYVCGPTVYNDIHIGNARPVVFFDVVAKYLEYSGYDVTFISNITDVDDKIINRAVDEQQTEADIVTRYTDAFLAVCDALGITSVQRLFATEYMDDMIAYIEQLIAAGVAYEKDGDVYFDVNKVDSYGALSNQTIENLIVGARIEENLAKKSPIDFTLWKATSVGIKWVSPWSEGRPGWHTECAAMIKHAFGGPIDIHGGGMDLKFPHHENERAHAHGIGWEQLATYWMHNGFIEINDGKMSKSSGEMVLAKDAISMYGKNAVRYWLLSAHYRQPLAYSDETLQETKDIMAKMEESVQDATVQLQLHDFQTKMAITSEKVFELQQQFKQEMDLDFNTANSLTVLHEAIKQLNIHMRHGEKSFGVLAQYLTLINEISDVLGFSYTLPVVTDDVKKDAKEWKMAKNAKDFPKADELREKLATLNIRIR